MKLEEKQEYYRYDPNQVRFKEPPSLPDEVARAMNRYGLNDRYRFLWMGVDVVRQEEVDPHPKVRGDKRATFFEFRQMTMGGVWGGRIVKRLTARKLFMRTRQLKGYGFRNEQGQTCHVARVDQVPFKLASLSWAEYTYHDFGVLEWQMQTMVTADEAIAGGIVNPRTEEVDLEYWFCIKRIVTADGLYLEPTIADVVTIREREYQNRNLDIAKVTKADDAVREANQAAGEFIQEIDCRVEYQEHAADAIDHTLRQPVTLSLNP